MGHTALLLPSAELRVVEAAASPPLLQGLTLSSKVILTAQPGACLLFSLGRHV